jgi:hypothetical protein
VSHLSCLPLLQGSDEKEFYVKVARIRKLRSNRSKAAEKWALLRNTVRASGLFQRTPKVGKGDLLAAMNESNNEENKSSSSSVAVK